MASLLERMLWLLGLKYRRPETRLSDEDAIEIATAYAESQGFLEIEKPLSPSEVCEVDGRLVWLMRTPTVGRWIIVSIDDGTGEVLGHKIYGVR